MEPEPIPTPAPPDGDKRDLLRRLTSFRQSRASRTEQILCDYLIAAYRDAAFLTAEELARAAGVSKATVIRLATKIGFASFNDLRERLRRIVADDLHRADREEQGPDALQPAQRLIALEGENVRRLARQLRWEDVEQAAHWLCGSRSVTVLGLGRCAALAVHAGYHLKRLLPHVYIYTAADASLWDHLTLAQDGGVVLAIGLRPCDRRLVEAVAYARSLGYPILAVVEEYGSPLSEAATVELPAPAATDAFTGAYAAPITLLTALVHAVAATLGEIALTRLRTLAEAGDALNLYC